MSADLYFTSVFSSFLYFRRLISEIAAQRKLATWSEVSVIWKRMSEIWDIPSPTHRGPKNHLFGRLRNLTVNFNSLYLWNETRHRQSVKCMTTTRVSYIVPKCHELWSTNGFKLDLHFYPPSVNSAFCFIARLRRRSSVNGNQPNFAK